MKTVTVIPKTKWAKERVKRHGPIFKVIKGANPVCCNGEAAWYMEGEDGWRGWFAFSDGEFIDQ